MNNEPNIIDNERVEDQDDKLHLYHLYRKSEFLFLGGEPLAEVWATRAEASVANDFAMQHGLIWVRIQA